MNMIFSIDDLPFLFPKQWKQNFEVISSEYQLFSAEAGCYTVEVAIPIEEEIESDRRGIRILKDSKVVYSTYEPDNTPERIFRRAIRTYARINHLLTTNRSVDQYILSPSIDSI